MGRRDKSDTQRAVNEADAAPGYVSNGSSQFSREASRVGGSKYLPLIAKGQEAARILIPQVSAKLREMEHRMEFGDDMLRKRMLPTYHAKKQFLHKLIKQFETGSG